MILRIGTRQSPLALWQAKYVTSLLQAQGVQVELVPIITSGDVSVSPLGESGGVGLFTKEIQRALIDGRCDLAVHSLKDLPTEPIANLLLTAVPPREDPRDCLLVRKDRGTNGMSLSDLPQGAIIGSGSLRRAAQVRALRPDLKVIDIRGNVDSRIKKLDDWQSKTRYDGILLAAAGLKRLGLDDRISRIFSMDEMLPAVGQAALGLETRADDVETIAAVQRLTHRQSHEAVLAERAMLRALRGGCLAPVAAHAIVKNNLLHMRAKVFSVDGKRILHATVQGNSNDAEQLGLQAADELIQAGATQLISEARQM